MEQRNKLVILGILLLVLDQLTKFIFLEQNYDYGFFAFSYVKNTGVSFGLLQGTTLIMIIVSIVVLGLLWYYREEFEGKEIFLVFIATGTVGNLIDRVFRGYVVDFINFKFFPVFNVADSLLTIGVIGFIIMVLIEQMKDDKKKIKRKRKK